MRKFSLAIKDIDRSWTRQQWKVVSRWLRVTANVIDNEMDWSKVDKVMEDCACSGLGIYAF